MNFMGFSEKLLFSTGPSATPHFSYSTCDQRLGAVSFGHQGGWLKKVRRNDIPVNHRFAGGTKRRSGRVPEAQNERFEENWQRWFGKEVHLIPFPSLEDMRSGGLPPALTEVQSLSSNWHTQSQSMTWTTVHGRWSFRGNSKLKRNIAAI